MKKLIIVCEEKYKKYGDYLSQLISLEDDTEQNVIGIKDGEVVAQVWSEKDYVANSPQIASSQSILFIGESKLIKDKSTHMKVMFSEHGIKYGWLGKQAVLTVDKTISTKEYDDFLEFALSNQTDIERLIEKKENKKIVENVKENPIIGVKAAGVAALGFLGGMIGIAPIAGLELKKSIDLKNKIKGQQYSCAIMRFYLTALSEFLGI